MTLSQYPIVFQIFGTYMLLYICQNYFFTPENHLDSDDADAYEAKKQLDLPQLDGMIYFIYYIQRMLKEFYFVRYYNSYKLYNTVAVL